MWYKRSRLNLGKISIKDSVAVNPLGSWAAAIWIREKNPIK